MHSLLYESLSYQVCLSLFNRDEIPYITVHCRFTNIGCLHFQQTLSIEALPSLCQWIGIKASTGLGYKVTGSISRGSSSTFNDDVGDKTSDLFTHKKNNVYSDG